MRFSVWPDQQRPWNEIAALVDYAEQTGWDTAYVYDHFMPFDDNNRDEPVLECWTTLTALAARTTRIRLGTLVLSNTYRHPALLANMAATLDVISGGRLLLGIGAGWQQNEHEAYGLDLMQVGPRLDSFEEACQVMTSLLREPRTTFHGDYYEITDAPCEPKPLQDRLPLLIGGKGEKRMLRVVATYADEWNSWTTPELFRHRSQVLDHHCADLGRDPASITRSTQAVLQMSNDHSQLPPVDPTSTTPLIRGSVQQVADLLAQYHAAGVDEFIVPDDSETAIGAHIDMLEQLRTEVAVHLQ